MKLAPVVHALARSSDFESVVCVTGQHRSMLDQILELFDIRPDIDLDLMEDNQTPASVTGHAVPALAQLFDKQDPDVVIVQGDTTTAFAAALAGFYRQIPVAHVEAGLRTFDRYSPFPEELNRRLISALATFNFAPTEGAAGALRREGIDDDAIWVTGNTVIDALQWLIATEPTAYTQQTLDVLIEPSLRLLLVTAHRRENFGRPLEEICTALRTIAETNQDVQIVYPVHLNPNVDVPVRRLLTGVDRVRLTAPLPYEAFARLMERSFAVLTDSGGLQEEAPALGKPVLVLRETTERPETVESGNARLVGVDAANIVKEVERLLHDPEAYERMATARSPYGDGHSAERIVEILRERTHHQTSHS